MRSIAVFLVLAVVWLAGLMAFAERVQRSTPAREPEAAEGVVALTGAGANQRIATAVQLLEDRKAERVLVSGVNPETTREDVRTLSRTGRRIYDCCVDLGFTAADTVGNARETLEWARARRYRSLIVVTADYHMPRAMLELRAVMPEPEFRLQSLAVPTRMLQSRRWWRHPPAARLMVVEYSKYLAILIREGLLGLGPRDAPRDAPRNAPRDAPPP